MKFTTNGVEHTPSTVMVFQSNDYNKFSMIKGNRQLDMHKIKKILADIDRGTNLLKYVPILVIEQGKKFEIIDGQHRFVVAQKIKHPVHYIIAEKLSLYDIARMNSNTEKWKAKDFIECYSELGNDHYKKLAAFLKEFQGLSTTSAISMLTKGKVNDGGTGLDAFHRGDFVVANEKEAREILTAASQFKFANKYQRAFLQAIARIIAAKVFPIEDLIARVNVDPEQLRLQEN
jgi:hypothetical protein